MYNMFELLHSSDVLRSLKHQYSVIKNALAEVILTSFSLKKAFNIWEHAPCNSYKLCFETAMS